MKSKTYIPKKLHSKGIYLLKFKSVVNCPHLSRNGCLKDSQFPSNLKLADIKLIWITNYRTLYRQFQINSDHILSECRLPLFTRTERDANTRKTRTLISDLWKNQILNIKKNKPSISYLWTPNIKIRSSEEPGPQMSNHKYRINFKLETSTLCYKKKKE